jgi:hypothetical protein
MVVKVVKVRPGGSCPGVQYIGRAWAGYPESIFHNPFHVGRDGDREEVLLKFINYWYAPDQWGLRLAARLLTLNNLSDEDVILGCWCKPLGCHGDIIAGYIDWFLQRFGSKKSQRRLWE